MTIREALRDDSRELAHDVAELRHRLHRRPEIGLELPQTQRTVLEALDGLPLEVSTGRSVSSVTAVLRGGDGGTKGAAPTHAPTVLLRGDMDALPVQEAPGLDYASEVPGAMHACGHDLHTAMLVGAARLLSAHRSELAGDVVFMFQPGEEGYDGASYMIEEGVLDAAGSRVMAAYGMHVLSARFPRGVFTTRPGTLMAASDGLYVTVRGAGGHGSTPYRAKDPVVVAAEMVTALQTMVTRRFDIFDPVVVTVGSFHAGTKRNIIPDEATFDATVRSFSPEAHERVRTEAVRVCEGIAAAHGVDVEVRYADEYPVTVNDPAHAAFAADVVRDVMGEERYTPMEVPDAGAEDFSRVLDAVPGCFLMVGATPHDDYTRAPTNHSPRAAFVDDVLADGVLLHASLAVAALQRHAA